METTNRKGRKCTNGTFCYKSFEMNRGSTSKKTYKGVIKTDFWLPSQHYDNCVNYFAFSTPLKLHYCSKHAHIILGIREYSKLSFLPKQTLVWVHPQMAKSSNKSWHWYLSVLGFSWGDSSGLALPRILFLASAYSASRWARDFTWGVGLFWLPGDPREPLADGRFRMRIWGGGAAGRESSWITMAVLSGDREELLLNTL